MGGRGLSTQGAFLSEPRDIFLIFELLLHGARYKATFLPSLSFIKKIRKMMGTQRRDPTSPPALRGQLASVQCSMAGAVHTLPLLCDLGQAA